MVPIRNQLFSDEELGSVSAIDFATVLWAKRDTISDGHRPLGRSSQPVRYTPKRKIAARFGVSPSTVQAISRTVRRHGPLWDLAEDRHSIALIETMYGTMHADAAGTPAPRGDHMEEVPRGILSNVGSFIVSFRREPPDICANVACGDGADHSGDPGRRSYKLQRHRRATQRSEGRHR
jgi:hypothetical protein